MKKLFKALVSIAVVTTMAICVTGCLGKTSLEDYVNSDLIQAEVKTANESSSDIKMEIFAEGDALVYEYTYNETVADEDELELYQQAFETELAKSEAEFVDIADSLYDVTTVKEPSVIVRYLNADGSLIYEQEFEASK